jgi:site-specific DNA-methyltransferase (adenine-specific)
MAWENAGWEPRDKIVHLFGSGFPKSHSVGKAIDKAAGAEREVVGTSPAGSGPLKRGHVSSSGGGLSIGTERSPEVELTVAATEAAKQWEGWGTALKPASEDWWLLRKPLEGTVAKCVLKHGTGALHIDACRVPYEAGEVNFDRKQRQQNSEGAIEGAFGAASLIGTEIDTYKEAGRWPANVTHDGSEEVVSRFPDSNGSGPARMLNRNAGNRKGDWGMNANQTDSVELPSAGSGSAARFFYGAKASVRDREEGLEALPDQVLAYSNGAQATINDGEDEYTGGSQNIGLNKIKKRKNPHPTVKSTELMQYLTRLITPAGGVCLDPFMGSGSTGKACALEGFRFVGIEQEPSYLPVAEARIKYALGKAK